MGNILKNIKDIRNEKGFSQEYMAEQLGVTQACYTNWEKGTRKLEYNKLLDIAKVLGYKDNDVINVITYPDVYISQTEADQKIQRAARPAEDEPLEAILQIRLRREKQNQVLKLVFGENDLEILNK